MTEQTEPLNLYVVSDSAGNTALNLAHATMAQFPNTDFCVYRKNFVRSEEALERTLVKAKEHNGIIVHTLINEKLNKQANEYCLENNVFCFDLLNPVVQEMSRRTGLEPTRELGAQHHLNENYFKRIKAIEFAVKYDDGKDPKGFLKADIVLLGVSRTSKTPLSLFLANKNLKVANLPLVPQAQIPDEIWKVNPKKIVGLTNDPTILNNIRAERMRAYGLDMDTAYSNTDNIIKELQYANDLYDKLGCVVINVAKLSIEETAAMILDALGLEDNTFQS
ncbi:MAG: kinase/pyrophosphorylase [Lactobacillales bacterium]|jgi:regulator of PEP synthase PpsR (kinase-PPPase family)|nr:kinase/pyrophosphorylase [Lactobacillales bacterium]